jgi:hypothetical protein
MSVGGVVRALNIAVSEALQPAFSGAIELDNSKFTPPTKAKWAAVTFKLAGAPALTLGYGGDDRGSGFVQVDLRYPRGNGFDDTTADVDSLRAAFPIGKTFVDSGQAVRVMECRPTYFLEDQWYRACVQLFWDAVIPR